MPDSDTFGARVCKKRTLFWIIGALRPGPVVKGATWERAQTAYSYDVTSARL